MESALLCDDEILLRSEQEFHIAAKTNNTEKMLQLMKKGVDVRAKNSVDRTALHWAAGAGHEQAVKLLLEHDVPVDEEDCFGMNALLLGAWFGHLKVLQILVNAGAKISCENKNGLNLLQCAAQRGHIKVMEFIMEDLEDIKLDKTDKFGRTALHLAAEHGKLEVVEFLIGSGCQHSLQDKEDNTALHFAAKNGHTEVLQKIVEIGVELNDKNQEGLTALHLATEGGHFEGVRILLEAECDVNVQTEKGMNALHYAAFHGLKDIARMLIDAGININAVNNQKSTALHIAVRQNFPSMVKLFIDCESDLDITDYDGQRCLETLELANYERCQDQRAFLKRKKYFNLIPSPSSKVQDVKFQAKNAEERDVWIQALNDGINRGKNKVFDEVKVDPKCSLEHVTRDRPKVGAAKRRPPTRIHLKEVADAADNDSLRLGLETLDTGILTVVPPTPKEKYEEPKPEKEPVKIPLPPTKKNNLQTTEPSISDTTDNNVQAPHAPSPPPKVLKEFMPVKSFCLKMARQIWKISQNMKLLRIKVRKM